MMRAKLYDIPKTSLRNGRADAVGNLSLRYPPRLLHQRSLMDIRSVYHLCVLVKKWHPAYSK
jgi:hypothetical protein